ncbi:MAG TPA: hypothetical protein VK498_11645 [Ferruginibacter sp.]|nr:hypothetical protein [Ferruginibacter sp.]
MKNILILLFIVITSCCSSKKNTQSTAVSDAARLDDNSTGENVLPACIKKLIAQFKSEEVQNPPRKIYRYLYNGNTVYYVTAPCCDFFTDLYDSKCNLIAHPDGGFTGKGDGRAADFIKTRTAEKLVWEDKRR